MNRNSNYHKNGFTLLELIVVIIIVGILSTLGLTTYTNQVEYSRTTEARAQISTMRKLAEEYYLKNGSLSEIEDSDVGVNNTCTTKNFYKYSIGGTSTIAKLYATRCTVNGKSPNASREYVFWLRYYPATGVTPSWACYYTNDDSSCFGLPDY